MTVYESGTLRMIDLPMQDLCVGQFEYIDCDGYGHIDDWIVSVPINDYIYGCKDYSLASSLAVALCGVSAMAVWEKLQSQGYSSIKWRSTKHLPWF